MLLLLFASCSFYRDLTGYFNTYYNSKKLFDDAVNEVLQSPQKDQDTNYFAPYAISASTAKKFDSVIVKCSRLIQFYPTTRWVVNGILMIGEAYEYQGESESAIRKFKELLANFPASDQRFEARLWMAKAEYHQRNQDEALNILKELFPELRSEGKTDLLLESLMLQAQIYTDRNEFDQASQAYALACEVPGDDAMRSFAQYQYGTVLEKLGDKEKAAGAFMRVLKFSPTFALEFRARLRAGMMMNQGKHPEAALKILNDLNDEPLKPEEHGLVDLEIANTYRSIGDTATAFPIYNLIDTTFKHTEASARSMYERGRYYEKVARDFKTARIYYAKSRGESQALNISETAARKATDFARYFVLMDDVNRFTASLHKDSANQVHLGTDTVEIAPPSETLLLDNELLAAEARNSTGYRPPEGLSSPSQYAAQGATVGGSEAYRRRHMDRDLVSDDEDSALPADMAAMVNDTSRSAKSDSLGRFAKPRQVKTSMLLTVDSVHSLLAQSYYELGALFFLELNEPDSAIYWYNRALEEFPSSHYTARTYYALAAVYAPSDSTVADSLDKIILDKYGETEYANELKSLKGIKAGEKIIDPIVFKYDHAESTLVQGNVDEAIRQFESLALHKPRHQLSTKSAYAVGWIYENVLHNNDSAASWYKRMLKSDSTSIYAMAVRPKLAVKDNPEYLKELLKTKENEVPAKADKTATQKTVPTRQQVKEDEKVNQIDDEQNDDEEKDDEDVPDTTATDDDDNNIP